MPIPIIAAALDEGFDSIPNFYLVVKTVSWLLIVFLLKLYFGGAKNTSERLMHSKVIMITGGTSGIGAELTKSLASRGAQIILLTHHSPSDLFLVDYIDDLRTSTNNELIWAEQVDLSSLHSIRMFATKWVDNAPPRRLDMIILCANTFTPRFGFTSTTQNKLEGTWGINYLANFHLLSILSPALRAQPPDRDVRVIFGACSSYLGGDIKFLNDTRKPLPHGKEYGSSKLALMVFAQAFQKHLDTYERPDKQPSNVRVVLVDPGLTRTPGMRRWLSMGSLWGLVLYLCLWPAWWLFLKSPEQGAQSFLRAAMEAELGRGVGGRYIKECREVDCLRKEIRDVEVARMLWDFSEKQIMALEKEGAIQRSRKKKESEEADNMKAKTSNASSAEPVDGVTKKSASRRSRKTG